MNDFETDGFLATIKDDAVLRFEEHMREPLAEVYEANRLIVHELINLEADKTDISEIVGALLFTRIISNAQSTILVCKAGLEEQAQMLLRATTECLFNLVALSKDKSFVNKLISNAESVYYKGIKSHVRYTDRKGLDNEWGNVQLKELGNKKISSTNTRNTAIAADLEDYYDTVYALTSDALHGSLISLGSHMRVDNDSLVVAELIFEPRFEYSAATLLALMEQLEMAYVAMCSIVEAKVAQNVVDQIQKASSAVQQFIIK